MLCFKIVDTDDDALDGDDDTIGKAFLSVS